MSAYWDVFVNGYKGYAGYFWNEITNPSWTNYFYWLIAVSLFFFTVEFFLPWRKNQAKLRKDFWLDGFYMLFNFFLFSLIIYNAASDVIVHLLNDGIRGIFGFDLQKINPLNSLPMWSILIIGFVVRDFIQWWVHRLLHRVEFLWEFHKVHHSVEEMGFAAHLRYHWMETIVYRTLEYLPLALLGIGLYDFFIIHIFTLAFGHYNHSNLTVNGRISAIFVGGIIGVVIATSSFDVHLFTAETQMDKILIIFITALLFSFLVGPLMKLIFNSPEMHIWHHSYEIPQDRKYGVNFGLTLAIWDFIFGTVYVPYSGRDIKLGFPQMENFPKDFKGQITHGFDRKSS